MATFRRSLLTGIAGSVATLGLVGRSSRASAETRSISRSGQDVTLAATQYDEETRNGALFEGIEYVSAAYCNVADVHYIISDGTTTRTPRDDATRGTATVTVSMVPEIALHNELPLTDGAASLSQRGLVTADKSALLVDNDLRLPAADGATVFTLANPEIGDIMADPGAGDEAWVTRRGDYECIVVTDGGYAVAFAQRETWRKQFDGQRIGIEGVTTGPDTSGWRDAYVEADGHLDTNTANSGDLDLVFGLNVGSRDTLTWQTAIGFGTSESAAIDNAVSALQNGYETERNRHIPWLPKDAHGEVRLGDRTG